MTRLRTHLSWAEYLTRRAGQEWYDWLLPRLGGAVELLPCLHYTPPSLSRTGRTSGPRRGGCATTRISSTMVLTRHGAHFEHVELWNEPNNLLDWDWREDVGWNLFCEMIGDAGVLGARRAAGNACSAAPVRSIPHGST